MAPIDTGRELEVSPSPESGGGSVEPSDDGGINGGSGQDSNSDVSVVSLASSGDSTIGADSRELCVNLREEMACQRGGM